MISVKGCLEKFLENVEWDKDDLQETDNQLTYSKRMVNYNEISKLISYDYKDIFYVLDDAFSIIFSNEKMLQNSPAIEKGFNKNELEDYIKDSVELYNYVDVELSIDKKKYLENSNLKKILNNFIIIIFVYSKNFVKWIDGFGFKDLESIVFSEDRQTIFIIYDCEDIVYNNNVLIMGEFFDENTIEYFLSKFDRVKNKKIAKWRYEQISWADGPKWINPSYFYFEYDGMNTYLKNYFLKNVVNLSIPYISNYSLSDEKNRLFCTFNGYKKIIISINQLEHYVEHQVKYLFELYRWAYSGENSDKLGILRNLISIFLCEDCGNNYYLLLLKKSKDIYDATIKNFDIYLQKNVEYYFQERNKVQGIISNKSNELIKEVNSIIQTMNTNLLSTAGIILAAAVSYTSNKSIVILKLAIVIYILYILIMGILNLIFYGSRYEIIKKDYNENMEIFKKILIAEDIPEYSEGAMHKSEKNFLRFWRIYLLLIGVLSIVGTYTLFNLDKIKEIIKLL